MTETNGDRISASPVTVGVVTPTLNAERYLERTLRSIWSQQGEGLQVRHVIVDGFSTDGTVEIAKRFPSEVVVAKDGGMYEAVNRGMAAVEGDIVGYINADDEIAPGALRTVADALASHPEAQWVCGRLEYIDGEDRVLGAWTPVPMTLRSYAGIGWSCVPQQTVWVRRSLYERVGPYDTVFKNCADYDWYAQRAPVAAADPAGRHGAVPAPRVEPLVRRREDGAREPGYPGAVRGTGPAAYLQGKLLSLRLNARNPSWLVAKKTGKITFTPARD